MSARKTADTKLCPSKTKSVSDVDGVRFFFFPCGHGDTLLIRLPGPRWGLIDCNLIRSAKEAFFAFVKEHAIESLAFVLLTHPDGDHYHGMADVIEHFSTGDRRIEIFIDGGLSPKEIVAAMKQPPTESEISELQRIDKLITKLAKSKKLKRYRFTSEHKPLPFAPILPSETQVLMSAISPQDWKIESLQRSAIEDVSAFVHGRSPSELRAKDVPAAGKSNAMSVVVVLEILGKSGSAAFLLPADAEAEELRAALHMWKDADRRLRLATSTEIDVVKMPHHGSPKSHVEEVFASPSSRVPRHAVVSAGMRQGLPSKQVIRDYQVNGWRCWCTTTRTAMRKPLRVIYRSSSVAKGAVTPEEHLVRMGWEPSNAIDCGPAAAEIKSEHLRAYE